MAYVAPYIDETGLHIPLYTDIRDQLITEMKSIFGDDIYIDNDSMDYQQISIFARKIFETNALLQLVYNNRTPITAIGVGLDNICVLGNIQRKPATNSIVQLTITGEPSTVIIKGECSDGTNTWILPDSVTIPASGIITVEAKSAVEGNIQALPNTINQILSPVYGWYGVTNNYAAQSGADVEGDASLRGRYSLGTRGVSATVFEGILSVVDAIAGVTRIRGYENDTGNESTATVPGNIPAGLPAHSITLVVEGGVDNEIAEAIYTNKTPGCYTNGTTEVTLISDSGNVNIIRFYRPTYKTVYVKVSIKKLAGWNDEYTTKMQNAVSKYIQNMNLAENVYRSVVWSVATQAMDDISNPAYSVQDIQFSTDGITYSPADIIEDFYNAAQTTPEMVTVTEV